MPRLSDTMGEGAISTWRKQPGDAVAVGDVLVEIETDKAVMEYEAYEAGTLAEILVPEGRNADIGVPIALLDDGAGGAAPSVPAASEQTPSPERSGLTPAPSLSRLHELIDLIRGAGLEVTLTAGSGPPLPPGVDLTAYRIVQEALTNALRHAPGSAAAVTVAYEADCLTVEVSNTARRIAASARPAPAAPDLGGGYGLAGIAERVASCGGSLSLGPGRDGSFTVTARLPLT